MRASVHKHIDIPQSDNFRKSKTELKKGAFEKPCIVYEMVNGGVSL